MQSLTRNAVKNITDPSSGRAFRSRAELVTNNNYSFIAYCSRKLKQRNIYVMEGKEEEGGVGKRDGQGQRWVGHDPLSETFTNRILNTTYKNISLNLNLPAAVRL